MKVLFATTNPAKVKKYAEGLTIYNGKEIKKHTWSKEHFYFIDKPSPQRNPEGVINFIVNSIKN